MAVAKTPKNTVDVTVGRVDLGVSAQLVALIACRQFLMPASFPFSDSVRDVHALRLKFSQLGSLKRLAPTPKRAKEPSASSSKRQKHSQEAAKTVHQAAGSVAEAAAAKAGPDSSGDKTASLVGEEDGTVPKTAPSKVLPDSKQGDHTSADSNPEAFLPVPTTGSWAQTGEVQTYA